MILRALVIAALVGSATTVLADAKTEAQLHIDRATTLHAEKKYAEASGELASAYALDPRPELLYALGQLQVALDHCDQAIVFYQRFLSTRPAAGPTAAATEAIKTCRRAHPGVAPWNANVETRRRIELATKLHEAGEYAQARSELAVAYSLEPDPSLLFAIGQLHVKLAQCDQAILYYDRFITANPELAAAAGANEAVEVCKTSLATPVAAPMAPVRAPGDAGPPPWYLDKVGLGLAAGGAVLAIVGASRYRSALGDLDGAEAALTHAQHAKLVASAHSKRTYAAVFATGAAVLTGAAVVRFVMQRRTRESQDVTLVPTDGGGMVTWGGSF